MLRRRGGKQDVHLSVKPLPKHMRLLPIIEEAVSKVAIMKARLPLAFAPHASPSAIASCRAHVVCILPVGTARQDCIADADI